MDIAALSMGMSQMNLHQQASISVMKMAIEQGEDQIVDLIEMSEKSSLVNTDARIMEQSVNPYLGGNIDIKL